MSDRRFIRDTVADNYKPDYIAERDRRLAWLGQVATIGFSDADLALVDFASNGEQEVRELVQAGRL